VVPLLGAVSSVIVVSPPLNGSSSTGQPLLSSPFILGLDFRKALGLPPPLTKIPYIPKKSPPFS